MYFLLKLIQKHIQKQKRQKEGRSARYRTNGKKHNRCVFVNGGESRGTADRLSVHVLNCWGRRPVLFALPASHHTTPHRRPETKTKPKTKTETKDQDQHITSETENQRPKAETKDQRPRPKTNDHDQVEPTEIKIAQLGWCATPSVCYMF